MRPLLVVAAVGCLLVGCSPHRESTQGRRLTQAEAEIEVGKRFHLSRYVTNEFIPRPNEARPRPLPVRKHLRIALQWIFTGDVAPWFVAQQKGFFSELGLDVELIEGGPGREMLGGVVAGRYDMYMGYPQTVLSMVASPTGTEMMMVCASMKDSGVGWMGLDKEIPSSQHSARRITASDLRGKRIGTQPGDEFLLDFLCDQEGLSTSEVTPMVEGATPDALLSGAIDYFQGLRSDQPRLLERAGYMNWTFLPASQFGYVPYLDVSAVTRSFYEAEGEALKRYVYALNESISYISNHRDEAASITVASIARHDGTIAEMRTRLDREIPLYLGDGSEPPLYISEAKLRSQLAVLFRYHRIELSEER